MLKCLVQNDFSERFKLIKSLSINNRPNFEELLKVPDRIPELTKVIDVSDLGKIIMAELTKFVNSYNVVRPMNAEQIAQCAFAIISTSEEDRLSLQDLIVFFDGAAQGKYGRVLDHIDQHVIFEMMEVYREERHQKYLAIKDTIHTQNKAAGYNERFSDAREDAEFDIRKGVVDYYKNKFQEDK